MSSHFYINKLKVLKLKVLSIEKLKEPEHLSYVNTIFVLIALISLGIRSLIPQNVIFNSPQDDFLGVRLAGNIVTGSWLGAWDSKTLSKPPGYSLFLAVCHFLHIPPQLTVHVI